MKINDTVQARLLFLASISNMISSHQPRLQNNINNNKNQLPPKQDIIPSLTFLLSLQGKSHLWIEFFFFVKKSVLGLSWKQKMRFKSRI